MNRAKKVMLIEFLIILVLLAALIFLIVHRDKSVSQQLYCEKHMDDHNMCLVSQRIYADVIPEKSQLVLNFNPLKSELQSYISINSLNASIYITNLRDGASFGIEATRSYPAASLNKIPIALLVLEKIEKNKLLTLDTKLPIYPEDRNSDSGNLYSMPFEQLSIRELLSYMLSQSDNTATSVLEHILAKEDFDKLDQYLNYYSNNISAETTPVNVTLTSAKTVSNILISLYLSTELTAQDSELILSDLANSSFDVAKYAGIAGEVTIAQKDGIRYIGNEKYYHDCGIIYHDQSRFSYCIMTRDIAMDEAPGVIGTMVNKTYNFIVDQSKLAGMDV